MDPVYFKRHLTFSEANDYIAGLDRRYHANWEQARLMADVSARCAGNKKGIDIEFPWEKPEPIEMTDDDINNVRAMAKQREAELNARLNTKNNGKP